VAGKGRMLGRLIKYGPVVYAAAQKYGPTVWEQVRSQREPAERFVQSKVAKGNHRKKALEHAATLVDGGVLQVFHDHESHWVVFTGDRPVAVHPATDAPYDALLTDVDLSRRVRPGDAQRRVHVPRPGRSPGPGPSTGPTPDGSA
jgi:hypothetical protein